MEKGTDEKHNTGGGLGLRLPVGEVRRNETFGGLWGATFRAGSIGHITTDKGARFPLSCYLRGTIRRTRGGFADDTRGVQNIKNMVPI